MSTTGSLKFLARAEDSPPKRSTEYFELAWMTKRAPALDPCKHALDDRYYQPEVDALIKWLWPVPSPTSRGWDKLEVLLKGRVEAVVRRGAVSCVNKHVYVNDRLKHLLQQSVVLQAWERALLIQKDKRERALRSYAKLVHSFPLLLPDTHKGSRIAERLNKENLVNVTTFDVNDIVACTWAVMLFICAHHPPHAQLYFGGAR